MHERFRCARRAKHHHARQVSVRQCYDRGATQSKSARMLSAALLSVEDHHVAHVTPILVRMIMFRNLSTCSNLQRYRLCPFSVR